MQSALFEPTGPLDALILYRAPGSSPAASELRRRASELIAALDARSEGDLLYRPANLHVLVAVSADLLTPAQRAEVSAGLDPIFEEGASTATRALLPPGHESAMHLGDGTALLCVQITAPTLAERVYALRLTRTFLNPERDLDVTILEGGRLGRSWEPFGYPDSTPAWPDLADPGTTTLADLDAIGDARLGVVASKLGLDPQGPSERPLWLLHQRYEHHFDRFFALSPKQRDRLMGMNRYGALVVNGHAQLAREARWAASLARRAFAYHHDEREGLAFQALSADPASFRDALAEMLVSHAVLDYVTAVETGLYLVPPNAAWLAEEEVAAPKVPAACRAMLRCPSSPIPAMTIHEVCPQTLRYLELARSNGLFTSNGLELSAAARTLFLALEQVLAGASVTVELREEPGHNDQIAADLELLRELVHSCSAAIDTAEGRYAAGSRNRI